MLERDLIVYPFVQKEKQPNMEDRLRQGLVDKCSLSQRNKTSSEETSKNYDDRKL